MSRFELPPQYDPHAVERPLYRRWLERGVFTARADSPKSPYVIVIPPPNVTAVLHMGQGLNKVTQGGLVRVQRVGGRGTVWVPRPHPARAAPGLCGRGRPNPGISKASCTTSATPGRAAPPLTSPWPPRAPKHCWATRPWP